MSNACADLPESEDPDPATCQEALEWEEPASRTSSLTSCPSGPENKAPALVRIVERRGGSVECFFARGSNWSKKKSSQRKGFWLSSEGKKRVHHPVRGVKRRRVPSPSGGAASGLVFVDRGSRVGFGGVRALDRLYRGWQRFFADLLKMAGRYPSRRTHPR